jgi:hypothetical protein
MQQSTTTVLRLTNGFDTADNAQWSFHGTTIDMVQIASIATGNEVGWRLTEFKSLQTRRTVDHDWSSIQSEDTSSGINFLPRNQFLLISSNFSKWNSLPAMTANCWYYGSTFEIVQSTAIIDCSPAQERRELRHECDEFFPVRFLIQTSTSIIDFRTTVYASLIDKH